MMRVRFAQFAPLDGLRDDQKEVVHPIIQILGANLTPEVVPYSLGEDGIQLLDG
jgi:hypothetical protein